MTKFIQWRQGYPAKTNAEKVYKELEEIRRKNGDIAPQEIVNKARSKRSAMHREFEWDDNLAAEKYKLKQARGMIRAVQVIIAESPSAPVQKYSSVTVATKEKSGKVSTEKVYTSTKEALQDPVRRAEVLANAIMDALAFRKKYAQLQELSRVIHAVDTFLGDDKGI